MNKLLFVTLLAGSMIMTSCGAGKAPTSATAKLHNKLEYALNSHKVMFGHHDDPVYGHTWVGDEGRSDILEIVGDYPAVMSWDLGGMELGDSLNLDGVPFERMRREVVAQDARGGINTFSWHLRNAVNGGDSWDLSDSLVVHKIATEAAATERYRQQLHNVAAFFNSLTDAQGNKIGVIFRPWHEHTGSWFWWGKDFSSVEDYNFLWHEMRRVFDADGVSNVLWAYSPDRVSNEEQYMERYPGDEYVDILGIDIYHFNGNDGTETYRKAVTDGLKIVTDLATKHNKIPALTETGLESVAISDWYTSIFLPLLKASPAVSYTVVWRNAHNKPEHFYAPYKGHASEDSFKAFYNDSTTLFAKDIIAIK
jgi:mannan endo-1,4-beta-mannosidase